MAALPVIDLKSFKDMSILGEELVRVGQDPGFFYVTGFDDRLNEDASRAMFARAEDFFSSSMNEKIAFANGSGDLGYTGIREETLSGQGPGDVKESFYLSDPGLPLQQLPPPLESGRDDMAGFFRACDGLAKHLLEGLAMGLGMPRNLLSKAHTGESYRMRLINYPPVDSTSLSKDVIGRDDFADIRAGAHSDYGSLTLLFRQPCDQGGLQVLRPGGSWLDVPRLPNTIVVNIGDALEFWTAGRLRSTVHRVVFPRSASENVPRMSLPVFIQPDRDVVLAPWKPASPARDGNSRVVEDEFLDVLRRKGYASLKPVTSHQHLFNRIRATYGGR